MHFLSGRNTNRNVQRSKTPIADGTNTQMSDRTYIVFWKLKMESATLIEMKMACTEAETNVESGHGFPVWTRDCVRVDRDQIATAYDTWYAVNATSE